MVMRGVAVGKEEGEEEEGKKVAEERRGRGTGAELHRGDTSSPASREALGEPVLYLYWDVRWGKPPLPSECDPHSLRNTCRACHCRVLVGDMAYGTEGHHYPGTNGRTAIRCLLCRLDITLNPIYNSSTLE